MEQEQPPPNERQFDPDASIVLVGCRGTGKRTLGFIGALHLRRRLVLDDHYFQQVTCLTRSQYLTKYGRAAFGQRSAAVFKQMLRTHERKCIIECGMGSLAEEAQTMLREYCKTHPVIYVHRDREQMVRILGEDDAAQLLAADESHRGCSNFEYFNLEDRLDRNGSGRAKRNQDGAESDGENDANDRAQFLHVREDFTRFLDLLQGQAWRRQWAESPFALNAVPPELRAYSYALRLRLSYLVDMDLSWDDYEACGDCVELIIDHWPDDLYRLIARQVALIRRKMEVPIVYHVEEHPREERHRSLEERDAMDSALLELGARLNVEYLSIDLQRTPQLVRRAIAQRGRSRILGNFWFPGLAAPPWSMASHVDEYRQAKALGCDVVRMVRFSWGGEAAAAAAAAARNEESSDTVEAFRKTIARMVPDPKPPLVAYDYSILGVKTPLQSRVLSPVKHPRSESRRDHLATVCTPGTAYAQLFDSGKLQPLHFFTVGSQTAHSITPAIHHAAFQYVGMPHTFDAIKLASLHDLQATYLTPSAPGNVSFGGALLAAPFKVAMLPHIQLKSQHATALGAVNVLLPLRGSLSTPFSSSSAAASTLPSNPSIPFPSASILEHANARSTAGPCSAFYGDNTDWRSINKCLHRALSPRNTVQPSRTTGLVIGAGGMARAAIYALLQLGCRHIFVYNRTVQHAHDVAAHFNLWARSQGILVSHQAYTAPGTAPFPHPAPPPSSSSSPASNSPVCHVLESRDQPWPPSYQPPTMIISCVPSRVDGRPAANFVMPSQWLGSPTGGVVVELAYDPLITNLVAQIHALRDSGPPWVVVDGLTIVSEMAIEAFELMTGRMAPRRVMKAACRKAWDEQQRMPGQDQQQASSHANGNGNNSNITSMVVNGIAGFV